MAEQKADHTDMALWLIDNGFASGLTEAQANLRVAEAQVHATLAIAA